jgi:hypothetical protein
MIEPVDNSELQVADKSIGWARRCGCEERKKKQNEAQFAS